MALHGISDTQLVQRAVRNARHRGQASAPRWACVEETFGLGSAYSADLCRQHGLNPDEVLPGLPCETCEASEA